MPDSSPDAGTPATGGNDTGQIEMAPHYYGGQAVLEGVMMRGASTWAVAVRQPDDRIWVECHPVSSLPKRYPILTKPMVRGVYALGDALSIGMKALSISAEKALEEEDEAEQMPSGAMGASMLLALAVFVGLFILLPSAGVKVFDSAVLGSSLGDGVWFHLIESVVRILIFLGYLYAISLIGDIRRVFQYHGAEHKTIAAWEHEEVLTPEVVDNYSTLHVRCGTNFLIMVMLLALIVYTLAGVVVPPPADAGFVGAVVYHVLLRIVLLPVVAGLAYEGLRLGASRGDNLLVRALVKPGLWLQLITTKQPTPDQIEVAIRAFEAVVPEPAREGRVAGDLPSTLVGPEDEPDPDPQSADSDVREGA